MRSYIEHPQQKSIDFMSTRIFVYDICFHYKGAYRSPFLYVDVANQNGNPWFCGGIYLKPMNDLEKLMDHSDSKSEWCIGLYDDQIWR